MLQILQYALPCAAVSLVLAWSLIRRQKVIGGAILGLVPMVIMEVILHGTLQSRIHRCLEEACLSKGLPADCGLTEFGCTEWSGLAVFMFWAAGFAALVVYAIGVAILATRARRRSAASSP